MLSWYILVLIAEWTMVNCHVNHTHQMKAERLKEKWGVGSVIRDLDHIREDMQSVIELAEEKHLTTKDIIFYMIRMHDFDDNGGLDGIELRVAVGHSMEHIETMKEYEEEEELERVIDEILGYDANFDGYVNYGEFVKQFDYDKPS